MKKTILIALSLILSVSAATAAPIDTVKIASEQRPILIDRDDNVFFRIRVDGSGDTATLQSLSLKLSSNIVKNIEAVKLYYAGTGRPGASAVKMEPYEYMPFNVAKSNRKADLSYNVMLSELKPAVDMILPAKNQHLYKGANYFWVSVKMKPNTNLTSTFTSEITDVKIGGKSMPIAVLGERKAVTPSRLGVAVRQAGDDGVQSYRIPGLVTSKKGTLVAIYDIRHNNSRDLQEDIDIGISRSMDGGQSWKKMQTIMDLGEYDGLPNSQNGIGDPAILVDETTGTLWAIAVWTHGMGGGVSWFDSRDGFEIERTPQLMLSRSDDDGKTWSKLINITKQVKQPSWNFLLQGPGRGITMKDGTLVFAIQYIDSARMPHAGIMYSKDHGETWQLHSPARSNTTEAQVVETEPGVLMLNMRDNRGGSRAVATTKDFGCTWTEHPSSRSALIEPVCMASIFKIEAKDNVLGKDILLFSNPNSVKDREKITIKASVDGGNSWNGGLLIDELGGWGYSCLTLVDREHVGILYEGSSSLMTYQVVPIRDIVSAQR